MGGLHLPREAPAVNKKSAGHRIGDRPASYAGPLIQRRGSRRRRAASAAPAPTASSAANAPNTPLTEAPVFDRPGCLLPASGLFGFTVSPGFVGSVGFVSSVGFVGSVGSDFSLTATTRLTVYDAPSESVTEYVSVYSPSFSVFAEPSTSQDLVGQIAVLLIGSGRTGLRVERVDVDVLLRGCVEQLVGGTVGRVENPPGRGVGLGVFHRLIAEGVGAVLGDEHLAARIGDDVGLEAGALGVGLVDLGELPGLLLGVGQGLGRVGDGQCGIAGSRGGQVLAGLHADKLVGVPDQAITETGWNAHKAFRAMPHDAQTAFAIRMLFTHRDADRYGADMFLHYERGFNVRFEGAGSNNY